MDSLNEQQRDGGFERLAQDARVDARMRSDTKPYTEQQREALLRELCNYRVRHGSRGSTLPWSSVANRVGIKPSTLTELRKGRYRGDVDAQFRKIDELLSDESKRASSDGELSGFASIGLTEEIFGVLNFGVVHRTMPVVVGEPGSGKTEHARAVAATREKGVYVRIDEGNGDARGVTELLCEAIPGLRRAAELTFRQRLKALREYLRSSLNTVVVVDEAQKLEADGLEVLRDLHDSSDPAGRRNVPEFLSPDRACPQRPTQSHQGADGPADVPGLQHRTAGRRDARRCAELQRRGHYLHRQSGQVACGHARGGELAN